MIKAQDVLDNLYELFPEARCELNYNSTFELLVAVILSAQCTDKRVNQVTEKLFKKYNTPEQFAKLDRSELEKEIYSCGFYSAKAKNIIDASIDIVEKFEGKVPDSLEKLMSLSGVGMKTAKVVLSEGFKIPAIAVDTHVGRVSRRLGLTKEENPDKVSVALEGIFDKQEWSGVHYRMVLFGRYKCKAINPDCTDCKFAKNCNFYKKIGKN